ncbi:MAG: hypothetical protein WBI04_03290 [Trichlorobacter sp.]|jgi:uncharacterized protein YlxW (UPF0749 family)
MERSPFGQYSIYEFIQEFFRTLFEILKGVTYAFLDIFHTIGPLQVILAIYLFVLALAVVSELKKHQQKREAEQRAFAAALSARQAEAQQRKQEREERISQYKQRDAKKKGGQKVPADAVLNYQSQKLGQRPNPTLRGH